MGEVVGVRRAWLEVLGWDGGGWLEWGWGWGWGWVGSWSLRVRWLSDGIGLWGVVCWMFLV